MDEETLSAILSPAARLRQVEPQIYSVLPAGEQTGSYDKMFGTFYDRVACSRLYNRLVWGYCTADYHRQCRRMLDASSHGWVLDAGCGSLAFTAKTYSGYRQGPVVLLDRSIKLLKLAKARLVTAGGRVPENVALLHADALELPFHPNTFAAVICLNLLHVFDDENAGRLLVQLKKASMEGGRIFFTTLVKNSRLADKYLQMWANAGELFPRDATRLLSIVNAAGLTADCHLRGNLAFVHCAGK